MSIRRIALGVIFSIAVGIFTFAPIHAEPVLVKLTLQKPGDWTSANSVGVVAYHRLENSVLAEFEWTKLEELDRLGLEYQIVDEEPWSEDYFVVFLEQGFAEVSLELYGKVMLRDPEWQLIKTSKERAPELRAQGYQVIPVHRSPIPLEYKPPLKVVKDALKYSANIDSLVNLISEDSLYAWDLRLQNFQTRYSYSDSIHRARQWLYDKFLSFGIDSVWFQHYYYDSDQYNVVATVVGTAMPDRVIVVGGHYDSVVYGAGTDPFVWAPGADDNATGTVAALEMARIVAENPLPVTVMFVPFAQEEQGLIGSWVCAYYLNEQNTDLRLMINSDMIAHDVGTTPDVIIYGNSGGMSFVEIMIEMAETYTFLYPHYGGEPGGSDHYSFWQWGYDAVSAQEGDFHYGGWHTNYDTVDSLDFSYMREVVKMCFATLLTVAISPSPVEGLEAVDAGDGSTVYVNWEANDPAEDIVHYNLYFGTTSGSYDSVRQVYATSDTLFDLQGDVAYFIAVTAENADGLESPSAEEVSVVPRVTPSAPAGLVANPLGLYKIKLDWAPNGEMDLDYYNIYRSTESGTGYQLLSGACSETTYVDSAVIGAVPSYYYVLTAVDTGENESSMSDEVEGYFVSLDQGILVVDETYENVSYNMVDGDSTNAFYDRALEDYTYAYVDHSCPNCTPQNQLRAKELGRYSVVIVHSEDLRGNRSLGASNDSTYLALKEYLDYGGKVIIEGRRNLSTGDDGQPDLRYFSPGDVPYDYLKVGSAYVPPWSPSTRSEEFIGAFSQISGYPDLQVDSLRVAQCGSGLELAGRVPGVGYINNLMNGEIIYTFHSADDPSSCEGQPVGFRNLGGEYEVVFFDFPLYFIQEPQAIQLLHQALTDLGVFTFLCGDCNADRITGPGDVVYLINYLFRNDYPPQPMRAGDVNVDDVVDVADVVYLLNYFFRNGDPPCEPSSQFFARSEPASAEISLRSAAAQDGSISVYLDAQFDVDAYGVQLELQWDPNALEFLNIQKTTRTNKLGLYHNRGEGERLKIGMVDLGGTGFISSGRGAVLKLGMKSRAHAPDLSSLEIKEAILVDAAGRKLEVRVVDKPGKSNLPKEFSLSQNYPNPFNPRTVIEYSLPGDCEVRITIYNILGQRVRTLVEEHQEAGYRRIEWDGRSDGAKELASGIYFYRIEAEEFIQTRKMLLLK